MTMHHTYRITAILKVDIFKTSITVFGVILTDNFKYQSHFIDTDNITRRDQREYVQNTDKKCYCTFVKLYHK